jgi:hypothetical protein
VNFNGYHVDVNGTLTAKGSTSNPIRMNGESITFYSGSKSWDEQTGQGCIFQGVIFKRMSYEYGFDLLGYRRIQGITVKDCSLKFIGNTNITEIDLYGGSSLITQNNGGNIVVFFGNPQIIENNLGVVDLGGGSSLVAGNKIRGGITANSNSNNFDCSPIIWNNDISIPGARTPYSAVISVGYGSAKTIISNNKITGSAESAHEGLNGGWVEGTYTCYGIACGTNAQISNNVISGCTFASIYLVSGDNTPNIVIEKNTLNDKGITINGKVNGIINQNNIQGGVTFTEKSPNNVDAANNWWRTTDTSIINSLIKDGDDVFGAGTVNYTPILTQANSQAVPDPNAPTPTAVPWNPTPEPTLRPTEQLQPTESLQNPSSTTTYQSNTGTATEPLSWLEIGIFTALIGIAVLLAAILSSMKKNKNKQTTV